MMIAHQQTWNDVMTGHDPHCEHDVVSYTKVDECSKCGGSVVYP